MQEIKRYLNRIFAVFPICDETKRTKAWILKEMRSHYSACLASGVPERQAWQETIHKMGGEAGIKKLVSIAGITRAYTQFKGRYPTFMALGITSVFLIPVLLFSWMISLRADRLAVPVAATGAVLPLLFILAVQIQNRKYQRTLQIVPEKGMRMLRNIFVVITVCAMLLLNILFKSFMASVIVIPVFIIIYYVIKYMRS